VKFVVIIKASLIILQLLLADFTASTFRSLST